MVLIANWVYLLVFTDVKGRNYTSESKDHFFTITGQNSVVLGLEEIELVFGVIRDYTSIIDNLGGRVKHFVGGLSDFVDGIVDRGTFSELCSCELWVI